MTIEPGLRLGGLHLRNTLTGEKDAFNPIDPANVRMYVCGPTVYDFSHIGNARPLIVFDVLFRMLRHLYGPERVTYVRNITDVDDKIIARARAEHPDLALNEAIGRITAGTERQFHEDAAALGCLPPTREPRATEHIADMVAMIATLVEKGYAYAAAGHVLFSVSAMPDYGRLSRRSLDDMVAGARVEVAPYKRDPMDFVLWKPSAADEPSWPSPWGPGRPGWHIECSAMADRWLWEEARPTLGEAGSAHPHEFDIHGGGIDLVFPHHENELTQSRCAYDRPVMARYWVHNGFLQVEGEKMAKSAGNFVTIRELLNDWPGDVLRLNMLKTHYRQPIDWTLAGLEESERTLAAWFDAAAGEAEPRPTAELLEALADDLNTPKAVTELHGLRARAGHKALAGCLAFLGLRADAFEAWRTARAAPSRVPEREIEHLLGIRIAARKAKDFAEADRIRGELEAMGIQLKDAKDPETGELTTTWEVKR